MGPAISPLADSQQTAKRDDRQGPVLTLMNHTPPAPPKFPLMNESPRGIFLGSLPINFAADAVPDSLFSHMLLCGSSGDRRADPTPPVANKSKQNRTEQNRHNTHVPRKALKDVIDKGSRVVLLLAVVQGTSAARPFAAAHGRLPADSFSVRLPFPRSLCLA